jgi:hypothetical protein
LFAGRDGFVTPFRFEKVDLGERFGSVRPGANGILATLEIVGRRFDKRFVLGECKSLNEPALLDRRYDVVGVIAEMSVVQCQDTFVLTLI